MNTRTLLCIAILSSITWVCDQWRKAQLAKKLPPTQEELDTAKALRLKVATLEKRLTRVELLLTESERIEEHAETIEAVPQAKAAEPC